jgi:type VI secretion system protein ImpM
VPIGLYGKLPSQGDFVSRRLPWEVTAAWDSWLQDAMSQARTALAADWNPAYLGAPLWRVQLAAGVLGPAGWIGLWFASVDRVGRQFPLLLLEPLGADWSGRYAVLEQDETFFEIEDVALRALDPRLAFDAFDRSLDGLSLLTPARMPAAAQEVDPAAALAVPSGADVIAVASDADAASVLRAAQAAGPCSSCFFSWGNEQHDPVLIRCDGLPSPARFRHFIDGRWG